MDGFCKIETEAFFWSLLKEVRDAHFGPKGDWDTMSVEQVLREMMQRSGGRLNPETTRNELERLNGCL